MMKTKTNRLNCAFVGSMPLDKYSERYGFERYNVFLIFKDKLYNDSLSYTNYTMKKNFYTEQFRLLTKNNKLFKKYLKNTLKSFNISIFSYLITMNKLDFKSYLEARKMIRDENFCEDYLKLLEFVFFRKVVECIKKEKLILNISKVFEVE